MSPQSKGPRWQDQKITTRLRVEWTDDEAWAAAEYLKRSNWDDFVSHAAAHNRDGEEPYDMRDGIVALQRALANAGFGPR